MLNVDFSTFPVLTSDRLVLRQLNREDDAQIFRLRSDPEVNRFVDRASATTIEEAVRFIEKIDELAKKNESIYWGISLEENNSIIGTICLWNFDLDNSIVETGYELLPQFQHKGIMTEALKKVIDYGFYKLNADVITAFPSNKNESSIRVLEKFEFKKDPDYSDEENMLRYRLDKNDWKRNYKKNAQE